MTEQAWQQPNFNQKPETKPNNLSRRKPFLWIAVGLGAAALLTVGGVVVNNQANHDNTSSPAVSVSYMPTQLPSGTVEASSALPTATTSYTVPKPTPSVTEQSSTPSVGKYPDVTSLQGKVGYNKVTDQTGLLWGKAVLSSDTNFIDLSCQKTYPVANLVVVRNDNTIRKTYPTYGYPDAAADFCNGTKVSFKNIPGAYATLLSAAIANAEVNKATGSPS